MNFTRQSSLLRVTMWTIGSPSRGAGADPTDPTDQGITPAKMAKWANAPAKFIDDMFVEPVIDKLEEVTWTRNGSWR